MIGARYLLLIGVIIGFVLSLFRTEKQLKHHSAVLHQIITRQQHMLQHMMSSPMAHEPEPEYAARPPPPPPPQQHMNPGHQGGHSSSSRNSNRGIPQQQLQQGGGGGNCGPVGGDFFLRDVPGMNDACSSAEHMQNLRQAMSRIPKS